MILRLLLYIICIVPYSAFCQTYGAGQARQSPSIGRALSMQHNPKGNFTRLRTYTSDDGRQYRDEYATYDGLGRPNGTVRPRFCPSGLGTATRTSIVFSDAAGRTVLQRSNPTRIGGTLFTETLYYNRTNEGSTPQYGGNISSINWETYNDGTTRPLFHSYNFTYDELSRLTATEYLKNGHYRTNAYGTRYTYDIMGNALSVHRNRLLDDGTYGPIDDLTLQYDGNRLTKVTDAAEGPYRKDAMHYVDGADAQEEFAYDANGNMTRNLDRHNAEEINHYSPCGALMDIGGRIILTESNISIKKLHRLIFYS